MTSKLKNIIVLVVVAILLFLVYSIFIKKDPTVDPLIDGAVTADQAQVLGNQISQALLRIEQIKLDTSIFDDVLYKTLVDRSEPISEEPIGRPNPFAPIGDVSSSVSTSRATTTNSLTPPSSTSTSSRSSI